MGAARRARSSAAGAQVGEHGQNPAVFQDGHLHGLLGVQGPSDITSWLPLFLFVVPFGLSMDYHVFILGRVREALHRGLDARSAVVEGVRSTAGVVTSAALVMVAVFSIFGPLSILEFKQMGVGLAAAILIDATIVPRRAPACDAGAAGRPGVVPAPLDEPPSARSGEPPSESRRL